MGISGIGVGPLILILVIVLLLFGTKKLKNIGGDLGSAIKGFKKAMSDDEKKASETEDEKIEQHDASVIDSTAEKVQDSKDKS